MHGAALGAELEVRKVIVPPLSGVFSAWGMCMTAPRADVVRTHILSAADATDSAVGALFAELERQAAETLERDGTGRAGEAVCTRSVDARYRGQEHTVRVPVAAGPVSAATLQADFHELHRRKYTFDLEGDSPVELVTFHVSAHGRAPREAALPAPVGGRRLDAGAQAPAHRRLRPRRHARDGRLRAQRSPDRVQRPRPARDRGADDDDARPPRAAARGRRLRQPRDLAALMQRSGSGP